MFVCLGAFRCFVADPNPLDCGHDTTTLTAVGSDSDVNTAGETLDVVCGTTTAGVSVAPASATHCSGTTPKTCLFTVSWSLLLARSLPRSLTSPRCCQLSLGCACKFWLWVEHCSHCVVSPQVSGIPSDGAAVSCTVTDSAQQSSDPCPTIISVKPCTAPSVL